MLYTESPQRKPDEKFPHLDICTKDVFEDVAE